jgi:hypothetical protein
LGSRWRSLFSCSLAFVLYIDRVCIGQAVDDIRLSLQLNKEDMSWVMNAFILSYCIFKSGQEAWGPVCPAASSLASSSGGPSSPADRSGVRPLVADHHPVLFGGRAELFPTWPAW